MIAGAIDFGGTKLMVGLVDDAGHVLVSETVPTPRQSGPHGVADAAVAMLGAMLSSRNLAWRDLAGVGSTVPALADAAKGVMVYAPAHGWRDVPFAAMLEARTGLTARIANDVNACAIAERRFGKARGASDFAWVTVSTGIGGGLMLNGEVFEGQRGLAGEVGQIVVEENGARVGGPAGSLEATAAGPAIARRAREAGLNVQNAMEVATLARDGDAVARKVMSDTGMFLARGLATLVNLLDLDLIVLGGGVIRSLDLLEPTLSKTLRERIVMPDERPLRLEVTALGYEAGLIGAATLILEPHLKLRDSERVNSTSEEL
jgi:glucokinase